MSFHQRRHVGSIASIMNSDGTITYSNEYTGFLGRWVEALKMPPKRDHDKVKRKAQWKRSPLSCVKPR